MSSRRRRSDRKHPVYDQDLEIDELPRRRASSSRSRRSGLNVAAISRALRRLDIAKDEDGGSSTRGRRRRRHRRRVRRSSSSRERRRKRQTKGKAKDKAKGKRKSITSASRRNRATKNSMACAEMTQSLEIQVAALEEQLRILRAKMAGVR